MKPIGIIHTVFKTLENMPVQPTGAGDTTGQIILKTEFQEGLVDLEGFSHIYLIYTFHMSNGYNLMVRPFLDDKYHGVFATRAPKRPNPIGLSLVRLLSVRNNIIEVGSADLLDGTPILDIKPYIEQFDTAGHAEGGWLTASDQEIRDARSDRRFK